MHLYLVQHAVAKSKDEDPQGSLTNKGQEDTRKVAAFLAGYRTVKVSHILHSGKLRARQTAEILAEYLHPGGVTATDGLNPLDDPAQWVERLGETDEDLMLVGHLPYLDKLASLLLTGDAEKPVVAFQNAGVVCLGRNEEGGWPVRWVVVPELLA